MSTKLRNRADNILTEVLLCAALRTRYLDLQHLMLMQPLMDHNAAQSASVGHVCNGQG